MLRMLLDHKVGIGFRFVEKVEAVQALTKRLEKWQAGSLSHTIKKPNLPHRLKR